MSEVGSLNSDRSDLIPVVINSNLIFTRESQTSDL